MNRPRHSAFRNPPYAIHNQVQPSSAWVTAPRISSTVIRSSALPSPASQSVVGALPRAMLIIVSTSSTVTDPFSLQSPRHTALGVCVAEALGLGLWVAVAVGLGVVVGVVDGLAVGVTVGVALWVAVGVDDGVEVTDAVAVCV